MRTNYLKALGSTIAATLLTVTAGNLFALSLATDSEISFSGGWRQDHLRSFTTNNLDASTDLVKGSHLNIWQVGLQTWMSPCMTDCEPLFNNLFVRGSAYWGWVSDGIYLHSTTPAPASPITFDRGDISHGRTYDYSVGAGYLFGCDNGFKVGPAAGYAWNKLDFRAENVIGVIDTPNTSQAIDPLAYFDEDVLFSSKWQGPWLGVDAMWDWQGFNLYASYEYHWLRWKGFYHSPSVDLVDDIHFSDKRSGRNGFGHSVYLGGHYAFCSNWLAGLGVKYQYSRIRGHLNPTAAGGFVAVGGTTGEVDHVKTTWNSVSVTLDLGYAF